MITWEGITAFTGVLAGEKPEARHRVTKSRSVTTPWSRPSEPHTGRHPILYRAKVRAATPTGSSGWMRTTLSDIISRSFKFHPSAGKYCQFLLDLYTRVW